MCIIIKYSMHKRSDNSGITTGTEFREASLCFLLCQIPRCIILIIIGIIFVNSTYAQSGF